MKQGRVEQGERRWVAALTVILLRTPCCCSSFATDTLPVAACVFSIFTLAVWVSTADDCKHHRRLHHFGRGTEVTGAVYMQNNAANFYGLKKTLFDLHLIHLENQAKINKNIK